MNFYWFYKVWSIYLGSLAFSFSLKACLRKDLRIFLHCSAILSLRKQASTDFIRLRRKKPSAAGVGLLLRIFVDMAQAAGCSASVVVWQRICLVPASRRNLTRYAGSCTVTFPLPRAARDDKIEATPNTGSFLMETKGSACRVWAWAAFITHLPTRSKPSFVRQLTTASKGNHAVAGGLRHPAALSPVGFTGNRFGGSKNSNCQRMLRKDRKWL